MINLQSLEDVKGLQSNLRASLGTPQGEEVMKFLETHFCFYDFSDMEVNHILIKNGARQVIATIKTLLEQPAEQIVALANKEN